MLVDRSMLHSCSSVGLVFQDAFWSDNVPVRIRSLVLLRSSYLFDLSWLKFSRNFLCLNRRMPCRLLPWGCLSLSHKTSLAYKRGPIFFIRFWNARGSRSNKLYWFCLILSKSRRIVREYRYTASLIILLEIKFTALSSYMNLPLSILFRKQILLLLSLISLGSFQVIIRVLTPVSKSSANTAQ